MELITQENLPDPRFGRSVHMVIHAALSLNLQVEVVDAADELLRIHGHKHVAWIEKAGRTAADNDITILLMDNKLVSSQVLREHGIRTPHRLAFRDPVQAARVNHQRGVDRVVIKPKHADQGQGISFLDLPASAQSWKAAFAAAQAYDGGEVLVEEWLPGVEHRFLVVDDDVVGVVRREAPSVIGDGARSVEALVASSNQNPLRSKTSKTTLYPILLDNIAIQTLASQGILPSEIPVKGQQVFLRYASNISTGGTFFDVTDEIDPGYNAIALSAARALGARLTGLDMLVENPNQPPKDDDYAVIELNKEPGLFLHDQPGRSVGRAILRLLGFEEAT